MIINEINLHNEMFQKIILGQNFSEILYPWFYWGLGNSTTDDVEARLCIAYATYVPIN